MTKSDDVPGAKRVLGAVQWLSGRHPDGKATRLKVLDYDIYLDLKDPRFLLVVNELLGSPEITTLKQCLSPGDTFVDVGANHGSFSIVASKLVGKNGLVVSIEPQAGLARLVHKSLAVGASCEFAVHTFAVGDQDGDVELFVPSGSSGYGGVYAGFSAFGNYFSTRVPLRRFDDAVEWRKFSGKTFVKLDVEGSESAFLRGAREMLATLKPRIMMEIHPQSMRAAGVTVESLKALLTELGYRQYRELGSLETYHPIETLEAAGARSVILRTGA
jgi:FkbM family methyltransferase